MKASRRSLPTREWNSNSCNSGLGSEVGTKRPGIASNFEPTTMDVAPEATGFPNSNIRATTDV